MQAAKEVVNNLIKPNQNTEQHNANINSNRSPSHLDSTTGTPGRDNYSTGTTGTTTRAGSNDQYLDSNATRGQTTARTTQNVGGTRTTGTHGGVTGNTRNESHIVGGTRTSGVQGGLTGVNSQVGGDSRYDSSRAATAAAAAATATGGHSTSHHKHSTVGDSQASQFVGDRKSDTEVREVLNPAVTKEVVIEENREEKTTAIDRELHQDHYQTRVQPVVDKKVLAEEHTHRAAPVEYRERKHSKEADIHRALEDERSRFQSTREVLPTQHVTENAGTVVGEHHHHHVYETVQSVIEREVIQPTVTHTTIPVHEHIEKDPSFHPKTIQPTMTMEEFVRAGGSTEGRPERMDIFEGEPQVMENGGADQTHPNAWDARGNHVDAGGATTRSAASKAAGIASGTGVSSRTGPQTTTTTTRHVEIPSGTNTRSGTSNLTGSNTRSGDMHQNSSGRGLDNTNLHNTTHSTHTSHNTTSGFDSGNLHNSSNKGLGHTGSGLDSGNLHSTSNRGLDNTSNLQQNTGNRGLDGTTRGL